MALSEDHIRRAVDEALEPVWAHERSRALRRWAWGTAGRVAVGMLSLAAVGVAVHLAFGRSLPWTFFAVTGALMSAAAFSQREGREHLGRD